MDQKLDQQALVLKDEADSLSTSVRTEIGSSCVVQVQLFDGGQG